MSRSELAMWDWIYLSPLMMMLNQYYDMPLNEFYLLVCATASFSFVTLIPFFQFFSFDYELAVTVTPDNHFNRSFEIKIHNFVYMNK